MQQQNSGIGCQLGSWALAAGAGLLVFVLLLVIGDWRLLQAIFAAGVVFAVLGLAFAWLFCRELPPARGAGNIDGTAAGVRASGAPQAAPSAAPAPSAAETASPAKAAPAASEARPDVQTATAKTDAEAAGAVKPSAKLAGQEDLAARKGEWKYEAEPKAPAPKATAKTTPAAEPETPGSDGDAKAEGTKPATLSAAREGGPDNLKEIKGVGPKLEKLLQSMGFYHFDQIANWTAEEEAWVNANLEGFKGRASRDNWVEQAKILASGGETEFSKRVDKGDVY